MFKRVLKLFSVLLVLTLVVGAGGFLSLQNYLKKPVVEGGDVVVTVNRGSSFGAVTEQLRRDGLIAYPQLLKVYARVAGRDTGLQAGEYLVPAGTTVSGLLDLLSSGDVIQHAVTLVEGRTLADNIDALSDSGLKRHVASVDSPKLLGLLQLEAPQPEGLFFSDTYFYHAGDTDLSVLERAHKRLMDVLHEEWQQRQKGLPYKKPYEALVMASVIERETAVPSERPVIAGVFVRRLRKGMRLQSDPTVIYGMGENYDGRIRRRDLNARTPYNTYRVNGLPPTPIALVGREAIHAALNPTAGSELYFVARGDGTHVFSTTLVAHNRAVRKYQLNRREDYRSTPLSDNGSVQE